MAISLDGSALGGRQPEPDPSAVLRVHVFPPALTVLRAPRTAIHPVYEIQRNFATPEVRGRDALEIEVASVPVCRPQRARFAALRGPRARVGNALPLVPFLAGQAIEGAPREARREGQVP